MTTISRNARIAAIRARAVNDATRSIRRLTLTHAEADDLGAETLSWLRARLGLTVRETAAGVEIAR